MPSDNARDPRDVLKRDKYFSLRPRPLEQWLWKQGVAPSAERVFWLHWHEGMRNADWCSEIPIRRVAQQCCLDVSTVTRAYQLLSRVGLIRRADPGRDPANPFQQATAITEVRVPRELLVEINRYPNRPQASADRPHAVQLVSKPKSGLPADSDEGATPARIDPFAGLSMKQRLGALVELSALMSAAERRQFNEAQRLHSGTMGFDESSRLGPQQRARVLQWLQICSLKPAATAGAIQSLPTPQAPNSPRKLTVFEVARLRRELQRVVEPAAVAERLREVVWSAEEGALQRFQSLHAIRIALKKMRDGLWSRPNRMPPNWARTFASNDARGSSKPTQAEICQIA